MTDHLGGGGRVTTMAGALCLLVAGCASAAPVSRAGPRLGSATAATLTAPVISASPTTATASRGSGSLATSPPTSPAGKVVDVGLAMNRGSVTLRRGQQLQVTLAANWTPPQAVADGGVTATLTSLRRESAQGFPRPGRGAALFTAIRPGTTTVTASTDYRCLHTRPACLPAQRLFTLRVRVVPPPGTGAGPVPVPPAVPAPPAS